MIQKNLSLMSFFFSSFLVVALFLSTHVSGMEEEENKNVAIILRPMGHEDVRVTRKLFTIESENPDRFLFGGVPVSVHSLNKELSLKTLPSQLKSLVRLRQTDSSLIEGVSFRELLDYWFSQRHTSQKGIEGPKQRHLKRKMILFPLPCADFNTLIFNYQKFGMTRKRFIETQTNSPFYSIFYRGKPLNIFILPTVHTLPLEALHPRILKWIHAIAETEGSKLIQEICDESSDDEEDDDSASLLDPRKKLSIEQFVARELKCIPNLYRSIYVKNENDEKELALWKLKLEEKIASSIEKYTQGWANSLNSESKEKLSALLKNCGKSFEFVFDVDPFYLYSMLVKINFDEAREKNIKSLALDNQICHIFWKQRKEVQPLENEDDRDTAQSEGVIASLPECNLTFDLCLTLLEKELQQINLDEEDEESEDESLELGTSTLDDLNFQDNIQMDYLMRRDEELANNLKKISDWVDVDIRNKQWWQKTINPLLEERIQAASSNLPPILIMYGHAHNFGDTSITGLIKKKTGFKVRRVTRK